MSHLTAQLLREIAERIRLRCEPCPECRVDAEDLERIAADLSRAGSPDVVSAPIALPHGRTERQA